MLGSGQEADPAQAEPLRWPLPPEPPEKVETSPEQGNCLGLLATQTTRAIAAPTVPGTGSSASCEGNAGAPPWHVHHCPHRPVAAASWHLPFPLYVWEVTGREIEAPSWPGMCCIIHIQKSRFSLVGKMFHHLILCFFR